jgi:hypothetical protein
MKQPTQAAPEVNILPEAELRREWLSPFKSVLITVSGQIDEWPLQLSKAAVPPP